MIDLINKVAALERLIEDNHKMVTKGIADVRRAVQDELDVSVHVVALQQSEISRLRDSK